MFRQALTVKKNTALKKTDIKAIKDLFERWFPDLSETEFYNIFPKKEAVNIITTITGSDDVVYIYTVRNIPIAFEHIGILFPTIFLLWRYPNLVPTLTTYPYVVKFIYGGADLKIEGVLHPPGGYKDFKEGVAACVNHTNNSAPVAVGITTASSIQVKSSSGSGKCLKVLHFYGDKLCQLNKVEYSIPSLGKLPEFLKKPTKEEFPPLEKLQLGDAGSVNISESKPEDDGNAPSTSSSTSVDTVMPEDMNYLLHHKMLTVLKYTKSYKLPILSSTFYKLMKDACSEGENLDVKKSTYKKIGKFLAEMQKIGLLGIKETKKGVDTIESINTSHPMYVDFYLSKDERPVTKTDVEPDTKRVTESYIITGPVLPIFSEFGLKKGDTVPMTEIRVHVREYVHAHKLTAEDPSLVIVNPEIARITTSTTTLTWQELMDSVIKYLKPCYFLSEQETVVKGKLEKIKMRVEKRANKKVTLVDNIELYGISIQEFAKECQHGVAASASTYEIPGKKSKQLMVQGDQTAFIYDLLKDKYKVAAHHIEGTVTRPKKKN